MTTTTSPDQHWKSEARSDARPVVVRRRWALLALVAVAVAFGVGVGAVYATHPRSEADFMAQLASGQGSEIDAMLARYDDRVFIAEGDQACAWLGHQEKALWNHGPWFDRDTMVIRYVNQMRPAVHRVWGQPSQWDDTRGVVASAAWDQLCGGTWWMHREHGPRLGGNGNSGD